MKIFNNHRLAYLILWTTFFAGVAQSLYYYPLLPNEVAIHFNASGVADNFSNKSSSMIIELALLFALSIMFFTFAKFINRIPKDLINLPNKDYWLAPERKENTYNKLKTTLLWIGISTNLFLILTYQNVIQANVTGTHRISGVFFVFLIIYLIIVMGASIYSVIYFSKGKRKS